MIEALIKSSIILLLTVAAVSFCRQRSAAQRHLIWTVGLIASVAVPFFSSLLPDWRPGAAAAAAMNIEFPQIYQWVPSAPLSNAGGAAATLDEGSSAMLILWGVWFSGAAVALLWLVVGMLRLRRLAVGAVPGGAWCRIVAEVSKTFGLKRTIRVRTGRNSSMLGTWGFIRPCVFVPTEAATWSEERVRAVLTHELAHIQRHDWLVHAFAEAMRAVFWINPLFWFVCSRLKRESEHASDDAVLRTGFDGPTYAGHLLELARTLKSVDPSWRPFLAMARPPDLERRFVTILNPAVNRSAVTPLSIFVVAVVAIGLTLPVAAIRAAVQETSEPATLVLEKAQIESEEFTVSAAELSITPKPATQTAAPRAAVPAQSPTGRLTGTVTDASGALVPGVPVFLGNASGQTQRTVSEDNGSFVFDGLAAGQYVLQAQLPGFATFLSNPFSIVNSQTTQINVPLRVGSVSSMVQVSASDSSAQTAQLPAGQRAARGQNPPSATEAQPGAPRRLRIGGNISAPRLVEQVRPVYPAELRNSGLEPTIIIEAVIGTDGRIFSPRVIGNSGGSPIDPLFVYAALDAVRQWRHSPAELNGVPVEISTTITVAFKR